MLSNAVAFYGCMALVFIWGVNTFVHTLETVENCLERIEECKKIATTDEEMVKRQMDLAECFTRFMCKDSEDDARIREMLDLGRRISMVAEKFANPGIDPRPSSLALTISSSYKTLVISAVTALLIASI
ncbi:unnamed protein product [Lymnaea stagnalis]|uniref:Uncharacterized protein n=1 Tax=Lymnaea stagnalis TaxID=6523 RepID=A0AAV2I6S0_LYMST